MKLSSFIPEIKIVPNRKIKVGSKLEIIGIGICQIDGQDETHWWIKYEGGNMKFSKSMFQQDLDKGRIKQV